MHRFGFGESRLHLCANEEGWHLILGPPGDCALPSVSCSGWESSSSHEKIQDPVCESHSRFTPGTRWAIGPLILLDLSEGTKLPRRQTRGLKSHNCHLFLSTLNHIEDKCLRVSQWRGGGSGNSPQVQKRKKKGQNSLFALRGVPIGLAAGFLSIYLQR